MKKSMNLSTSTRVKIVLVNGHQNDCSCVNHRTDHTINKSIVLRYSYDDVQCIPV